MKTTNIDDSVQHVGWEGKERRVGQCRLGLQKKVMEMTCYGGTAERNLCERNEFEKVFILGEGGYGPK